MEHTALSRRPGPFAVLVVVGFAAGAVALHALALWFHIFPSDLTSHRADTGLAMFGFVAVAGIVTVLGLLAAVAWERHGGWGAQARKGRDRAQISISAAYGKPGVVGVSLSVTRDDRPVTSEATSI